jgi:hypothetical protein
VFAVKMLRGQKLLDLNKSFTVRVTYKRRNKEVHTTVEKEMFNLFVCIQPHDPQAEQKGTKKRQIII